MVTFNSAIRPACLPEQFAIPDGIATVSGWGLTKTNGNQSNVLLKTNLDLFSQEECDAKYPPSFSLNHGIVEQTQLCAGSHIDGKDTCDGDSFFLFI